MYFFISIDFKFTYKKTVLKNFMFKILSTVFTIYYSLSKIFLASLKKLRFPQRSKSPIIAKRFFARVAATFKILAACAAHFAEDLELLSQPNNNITELASLPWNL